MTRRSTATALSTFMVFALLAGCSATSEPGSGDLLTDLTHRDPRILIRAIRRSVAETASRDSTGESDEIRAAALALLVGLLEHPDGAVQLYAAIALRKITGQEHGFRSHASEPERVAAVGRWRDALGLGKSAGESLTRSAHAESEATP